MSPLDRLILKAARRYSDESVSQRRRDIQLNAFAEVAADVLKACVAPAAFELAVLEALKLYPQPSVFTLNREAAQDLRDEWEAAIVVHAKNAYSLKEVA